MKNIFTILMFVSSLSLSAQKHVLGFKAGASHTRSNIESDYLLSKDRLLGSFVAFNYETALYKKLYLGTGLMYYQSGAKNFSPKRADDDYIDIMYMPLTRNDYRYHNVSIPLYVGIKTPGKLHGFANAGILLSKALYYSYDNIYEDEVYIPQKGTKPTSAPLEMLATAEAGVGFNLNEKWSLNGSASWINSLGTSATCAKGMLYGVGLKYTIK